MINILSAKDMAIKKFLEFFPRGFIDEKYLSWERNYKWNAHSLWNKSLNKNLFNDLLSAKKYKEITNQILKIEGKTNLLFSFEKMAIRDALKSELASKLFSESLYHYLYTNDRQQALFNDFIKTIAALPREQTRVLTWPVVTVFPFIADPKRYIFLKPKTTKVAAALYQFPFEYISQPNWSTYQSLILFAKQLKSDLSSFKPKDYIDIQSFIWTLGSDEYNQDVTQLH
ncbi:MAG: hypothetical protein H0U75_08030 [Legionella sp.]|nr:hypothetical protein [Legionella sp.]